MLCWGEISEVIKLNEKQKIIKLYLEGVSKRKIALQLKKSRNTVSKYIKQFEESKQKDTRNLPIPEEIIKPPTYKKREGKKTALTDQIKTLLRGYIKENEWKKEHYMSKQQMKIVDMHEKLMEKGHSISYTTVRNFVNKEIKKKKEVYIRRYCKPGYEAEFDWGQVRLDIDGRIKSYSLAVFTLAYSNYRFAFLYSSESQICVLDVHTKFIEQIGFIPTVFTYDNMRTVVKSFVGNEKVITDCMKNLANYYQFNIRLCGARKGNEKGHVERSVEFIRRKAFSSEYTFTSLKEANTHLLNVLDKINNRLHHEHKKSHIKLMEEEKVVSLPAIATFDVADLIECRVDKYSTVTINKNRYSVPEGHVGSYIKAKVGAETIKLFVDGKLAAEHSRSWGVHNWSMDIDHFLETFKKKKGAVIQSECLRQAPTKIKKLYNDYYIGKEKEFIELLIYIKDNNNLERVNTAIAKLEQLQNGDITTEKILFLCEQSINEIDGSTLNRDETTNQSENNMKAYANLFNQTEVGAVHYG